MSCRTDLVQGCYEVYLKVKDEVETVETLERIISKNVKWLYNLKYLISLWVIVNIKKSVIVLKWAYSDTIVTNKLVITVIG